MPTSDSAQWVAFLVCAFFLGHLLLLIGSYIDPLYNRLRERRSPYSNDSAYACATEIRDLLIDANERKALNTFQWSRATLITSSPVAADEVHRLEADSEYFLSMMIVCVLASVVLLIEHHTLRALIEHHILRALIALVLVPPCFARYYEQRLKSTTQAYIHVITLYRAGLSKGIGPPVKEGAV